MKNLKTSTFIFFFFFVGDAFSQTTIDSLKLVLATAQDDSNKATILYKLSEEYFYSDNYESALFYGNEANRLSKNLNFKKGIAFSYYYLGKVFLEQRKTTVAREQFLLAMKEFDEINNKTGVGICYGDIGSAYKTDENYEKAIENYLYSLKIYEEADNKSGISFCLGEIGILYFNMGNYSKAIEYHTRGFQNDSLLGDSAAIANSLNDLANAYDKSNQLDKALISHERALKIRTAVQDEKGIALSLANIAIIYKKGKNYSKALEFYDKALNIFNKQNDFENTATAYDNISEIYFMQRNYMSALNFARQSLSEAEKFGSKNLSKTSYHTLAKIYYRLNDYKNAYNYFELYSNIKDTLFNESSSKNIARLQTIYETDKKQKEIELLNKDNEIQTAENKKQRIAIYSASGGLVLMLALAFFIFRGYKQKQKANLLLERKNIAISQQKEEIEKINIELEKLSIVASETDNSVFIMDAEANLEWANAGFTRLFGFTLEEYIEKNGKNILGTSGNPEIKSIFQKVLDTKKSVVYEVINETKNGNKIWVQTTLTPIIVNGNISKIVAIDSNITEIKKAEAEIKHKNHEITDSINYASKIQQAILPSEDYLKKCFDEFCVLFKPKDIVSGDFFWTYQTPSNKLVWAAVDCTGHGVPGAFMSMIGNSLLNEIVVENEIEESDKILNQLRESVIKALRQTGAVGTQKDGMDIALCVLDKNTNTLQFSGANNPLWLLRNNECIIMKPDKQPIGYYSDQIKPFTKQEIPLIKKDTLFTFTDGYEDQFGGPKQKKFMSKQFRELLLSIQYKSMPEQKEVLNRTIENWKNGTEQIDDICVFGVRV